jgi:hypothetical protein
VTRVQQFHIEHFIFSAANKYISYMCQCSNVSWNAATFVCKEKGGGGVEGGIISLKIISKYIYKRYESRKKKRKKKNKKKNMCRKMMWESKFDDTEKKPRDKKLFM